MKIAIQKAKLSRRSKAPVAEREFLRLYSEWQETRHEIVQRKMFLCLGKLLRADPGFDFRTRLWQVL